MSTALSAFCTTWAALWNRPQPADDRPARRDDDAAGDPLPELGFDGYRVSGVGEYVLRVCPGSTAERLGLASGDVILAVNGRRLTSDGVWRKTVSGAATSHGQVSLEIREGRSQAVAHRTCHLFSTRGVAVGEAHNTIESE